MVHDVALTFVAVFGGLVALFMAGVILMLPIASARITRAREERKHE